MMKHVLLVGALLLFAVPAFAQSTTRYDEPLSDRLVSYTMDVALDPETRTVSGTERVTWRNPDQVPVEELQFHLYLNAFKNEQSTFMRESGGQHRGFTASGDDVWGGTTITRMTVAGGDADPTAYYQTDDGDLTDRVTFIQPDDDNTDDETVVSVRLPKPIQPGETIALDVDFESKLPRIFARTGWEEKVDGEPFFMVAQWFPKLGVYEVPGQRYVPEDAPRGAWYTHQFHSNSEFYADFGTYDVTMTVPDGYVVGASGVRTGATEGDGPQTITYRAEDVHDFAWTASPDFLEYTDTWRHVNLRLLLQPEHEGQAQRHFDAAKAALERFDRWVGEYPYTTLTLVDGLGGSNGMEYPTLITCGTVYMLPEWLRMLEVVTIHEFGHQYFYGLLASNEAEEAWLDEGVNSYLEVKVMDDTYGPGAVIDFPGFKVSSEAMQRVQYTKGAPTRSRIYNRSWEYKYGDYGVSTYAKPATVMLTLERYVGWDVMQEILRTYYDRWRFRHPTTRDFIDVAEDVSGEDLSWFFDQYVYGTVAVDYAVDRIRNKRLDAGEDEDAPQRYEGTVLVHRKQDGIFPQTLRVRFDDGTSEDVQWDGKDEWKSFAFEKEARIVEAYLDPDNDVVLDVDRVNNRQMTRPSNTVSRKAQLKTAVWLQQVLYLLSGLL